MREMGYRAVEMLMRRMDGQEVEPVQLETELVIRDSVRRLPVAPELVTGRP